MRSPLPASPRNVSGSPPRATPSRTSSARPRVTSAAIVFMPKSSPAATPAAMAMTFFTAPPISQPTTSALVYTRNVGPVSRCCTAAAASRVGEGHRRCRRVAGDHLAGQVRSGEHADRARTDCGEHVGEDLGHPQPGAGLDPLGHADHDCVRSDRVARLGHDRAQVLRRYCHHDDVGTGHDLVQIAAHTDLSRQRHAWQEQAVLVLVPDRRDDVGLPCPQPRRSARRCQGTERGPPRPTTDHRDRARRS